MVALLKNPLRLTTDEQADTATEAPAAVESHDDRRMFPRKENRARVQGTRLDHSISARQQPHLSLSLRDISVGGLSAITQMPLGVGERVAVFFPPEGAKRGWDVCGRILRCEAAALGYRVAVQFEALPAAA